MCSSKQYKKRNQHLKHGRKDTELHFADPEHREGLFGGAKYCYTACIRRTHTSAAEAIVQLHTAEPTAALTVQHAQAGMEEDHSAGKGDSVNLCLLVRYHTGMHLSHTDRKILQVTSLLGSWETQ